MRTERSRAHARPLRCRVLLDVSSSGNSCRGLARGGLDMEEAPDATTATYAPAPDRYDGMPYRRVRASGLRLTAISLRLWQNFGADRALATQRAIVARAFDRGVTHFDLANNYGPPYGAAEANFGRILGSDLRAYRDELIISTKAGYDMWPGPYGDHGSRKYLRASLDQSLGRLGLDYVDIFYSHRVDPETPLEETMGALDAAVRQGKALYVGTPRIRRGGRVRRRRSCVGSVRRSSSTSRPIR